MKPDYDVSVLVLTYNPDYEKLIMTIRSALLQKKVSLQIVIADDGSDVDYFDILQDYFEKQSYVDYELVKNVENIGIVKNTMSGIKKCKGKYIKLISPGDYLFCDNILCNWMKFMKDNDLNVSGADYVCYYLNEEKHMEGIKQFAHPQFVNYTGDKLRFNYLIHDDIFLGAATLCKKNVLEKYVSMLVGNVKYAEDNCYRLMAYYGENMGFYKEKVILYEIGNGVSTCGNDKWAKLLRVDWEKTNEIINKSETCNVKLKKAFTTLNKAKSYSGICKYLKYFGVKGLIFFKIKVKLKSRILTDELPLSWIKEFKM